MQVCSVDSFLETLAPFSPNAHWIDHAYNRLLAKNLLQKHAKTTPPQNTASHAKTPGVNTKKSGRERKCAKPKVVNVEPQVNAEVPDVVQWTAYCDATPKEMKKSEMVAYKPLEEIVEALRSCPDPDPSSARESSRYCYQDCPHQQMKSEIMGASFRVDAVISNSDIYKEGGKEINLAAAQAAVVMEFKKKKNAPIVYKNRKQLVTAANHIMNDDPRRNWMYGITIEDTNMSLWYFSRSYSMKSDDFDFTKDIKTFIRVFLSFLYANDEELGHDPSIYWKYYGNKWCYVYKLETQEGSKYYRTLELLYSPRFHCITGRKSRVWKVVEVPSLDDLEPKANQCEFALKDCWVDDGSLLEKEVQTRIFERLKGLKEADYAWASPELRKVLKDGIACPERYFMKIQWDWKQGLNKEKPQSEPEVNLLSDTTKTPVAKVIVSTQTPPPTACLSSHASDTPNLDDNSCKPRIPRRYKVKQHYRVVYAEVGEALAHAKCLSDAVRAFEDIFIALTLMFLAGWVHWDVSEGNIILVRDERGLRAKLSDLEYARFFNQEGEVASADPKTGTPYFMPIEIHRGSFLFRKSLSKRPRISMLTMNEDMIPHPEPDGPTLRYDFAHDLESLWWIMVWIIVVRVKDGLLFYDAFFAVLNFPPPDREDLFLKGDRLHDKLEELIQDTLCDRKAHKFLTFYNHLLYQFYESGNRQDATSYQSIYNEIWDAMKYFNEKMLGVTMKLEDPHTRTPSPPSALPISQELGKRRRSLDNGGGSKGEGSSRKKLKSGRDVFEDAGEDTGEGDTTEEDTVQDMAKLQVEWTIHQ